MQTQSNQTITLTPSNWLYNAGVIGFLRVLESSGENVENFFLKDDGNVEKDDGSVGIDLSLFYDEKIGNKEIPKVIKHLVDYVVSEEDLNEWKQEKDKKGKTNEEKYKNHDFGNGFGYKFIRAGNKLFASKTPFQNLVQLEEWKSFEFIKLISKIPQILNSSNGENICNICGRYKIKIFNPESVLERRLANLQITHLKELGPSIGEFPNTFWNSKSSVSVCLICVLLILHHRESFIKLSDNSQIFINAPSFKVMWHLNKYARTLYEKQKTKEIREILGISLIEMASRLQLQLSKWTKMNIEVVVKYKENGKDKIDFFSLPYEVVDVLSDKEISSLLNRIGEFKILNMVLDGKFDEILKFGERVFRIVIKPKNEWGKHEKEFINENIKLERNRKHLTLFSQNLFELYALIMDKIKKEEIL